MGSSWSDLRKRHRKLQLESDTFPTQLWELSSFNEEDLKKYKLGIEKTRKIDDQGRMDHLQDSAYVFNVTEVKLQNSVFTV